MPQELNTTIDPIRWINGATALNDTNLNTISDNIIALKNNDIYLDEELKDVVEKLDVLSVSINGGSADPSTW